MLYRGIMVYRYVNGNIMKKNLSNELDEYYTKPEIAIYLYKKTCSIISKYDDVKKYTWIEPSVGNGDFYKLLPKKKTIGIDIKKTKFNTIKKNYLEYELPKTPCIVIGNPPFGHRGVLALQFIQHSKNAEYVAFILPMFFQSKGKGSIRYRVKGLNLLYEVVLPENSFYIGDKAIDVKCCFQIWSKYHSAVKEEFSWYNNSNSEPFSNIVSVKTVSLAKNRECGKEFIFNKKANHYLSSTFFNENHVVQDFKDVKYKSGIAIIYQTHNLKLIKKLDNIFKRADWTIYSSLATNGCRHIGKSHIFQLLSDSGVKNG